MALRGAFPETSSSPHQYFRCLSGKSVIGLVEQHSVCGRSGMQRCALGITFSIVFGLSAASAGTPPKTIDFRLEDTAGKTWASRELKEKKGVVVTFLGTQCPINNAYLPRLAELHEKFATQGVQFFGINANQHDTPVAIAAHAKKNKLPFPVLRDADQKVADQF